MKFTGLDDDRADLAAALLKTLEAKRERNALRSAYYNAKRLPDDLGVTMPPHLMHRVRAVLGWPSKAVDTLVQRIHFQEFTSADSGVQDLAAEVTEANRLASELPQVFTAGLEHSVAFLLVSASNDDDVPRIIPQDALHATGEWDHRRRALSSLLSVAEDDEQGSPLTLDLYVGGLRYELHRDGDGQDRWRLEGRYASGADATPAEILPYKPRLGRPFGSSRISRPVMSITDMAVRTVLRSEIGAEFYAIPQRWLMGADMSAFGMDGATGSAAWKMLVGRIMALDDDDDKENPRAQVGQFPQASQQPHMDQLRSLAQLFAGETSIPVSSLGISIDSNPTSADSYAASREDIIAEAEQSITIWRGAVERTMSTALSIMGVDDAKVRASFRDPRYTSRSASADAMLKVSSVLPWLGSTPEAIDMLGLDDVLTERLKAAQRRQGARSLLDTLSALPARED